MGRTPRNRSRAWALGIELIVLTGLSLVLIGALYRLWELGIGRLIE